MHTQTFYELKVDGLVIYCRTIVGRLKKSIVFKFCITMLFVIFIIKNLMFLIVGRKRGSSCSNRSSAVGNV